MSLPASLAKYSFDRNYSQNAWGRVTAVEYSVDRGNSQSMPVVEMYSYAAAGAVEKKLQYTISPFAQTLEAVSANRRDGSRVSGMSRLSPKGPSKMTDRRVDTGVRVAEGH